MATRERANMDARGGCFGQISSPTPEELRVWQNLVSLWDREWKHQWAILKRSHLLLFDRQCSSRPSAWVLLRHAKLVTKSDFSGKPKTDLDRWLRQLQGAIAKADVDSKACRPLPCSPVLVKQAALSGIPDCFRGTVWFKLSGADRLASQNPCRYRKLLRMTCRHDSKIERDVHRTMATLHFFSEERSGAQAKLFNVMRAYAVHDPEVGYCQGMNYLAAVLLLHMGEDQAFWVLVQMLKRYRLRDLFMAKSPQLAAELYKFGFFLQRAAPSLYNHFTEEGVEATMFLTGWVVTLFTSSFPLQFSLRVWDAFFVLGLAYVLQVAVVLIRKFQDQLLSLPFQEILLCLRGLPSYLQEHPELVAEVLAEAHDVAWMAAGLEQKGEEFVKRMAGGELAGSPEDAGPRRRCGGADAREAPTPGSTAQSAAAAHAGAAAGAVGRSIAEAEDLLRALGAAGGVESRASGGTRSVREGVPKARPSDTHVRSDLGGEGGGVDGRGSDEPRVPRLSDAWPGLGFEDADDELELAGGGSTVAEANGQAVADHGERLRDVDAEEINRERCGAGDGDSATAQESESEERGQCRIGAVGVGTIASAESASGRAEEEGDQAGVEVGGDKSWRGWPFKW